MFLIFAVFVVLLRWTASDTTKCSNLPSTEFTLNHFSYSTMGAEILGVNLETINDADFDKLHASLLTYKVLVIRDQRNLTVEGLRTLTKKLGPLQVHLESSSHFPGYEDVNVVSNMKNSSGGYTGLHGKHVENFHSDLSWAHLPTKVTVLHSIVRPDNPCGNTLFADTEAAYDALDDEMKKKLEKKKAIYSYLKLRDLSNNLALDGLSEAEKEKALDASIHPIITMHPITGRKNIYANPSHTVSIQGMDPEASAALLEALYTHTAKPEFRLTHVYRDFDLVMWDNRAVQHRAAGECPPEFPRKLIRTTVSCADVPKEAVDGVLSFEPPYNLAGDRQSS